MSIEKQKLREKLCQIIYGCSLEELRMKYELDDSSRGDRIINDIINLIEEERVKDIGMYTEI